MKFTLLILLCASFAAAQSSEWSNVKRLAKGDEIRVSTGDGKTYRGQLSEATDESLIMIAAGSQEALARAQIKQIAIQKPSHRKRNTLIGLGIGVGAGLAIGTGADHSCAASGCFIGPNFGKEVFTPLGAIIGTIFGVVWPTGGWHNIYRVN